MRGRMLIIGLALAAVAIAFVASAGGDPERSAAPSATPPPAKLPADALKLSFVYSPEKELLLDTANRLATRPVVRKRSSKPSRPSIHRFIC